MAFNPGGPMPVSSTPKPKPSPGPSPTPSPSGSSTTTQGNSKPYSGPTFQNPGQSQGGGTYYGGFHGVGGQQNTVQPGGESTTQMVERNRGTLPYIRKKGAPQEPPTPIPNATAHAGPYVTPAASQLGAVNHPNDRTGSRAYAGLTGHATPNMLTDAHAVMATPRHLGN